MEFGEMEPIVADERLTRRIRLVEKHVEFENLHDLEGILSTFGQDAKYDDEPWADHRVGRDAVRAYYTEVIRAVPDLHIEILNQYLTSEAVILEVVISGTHQRPWRGLPGTGRFLKFPLCAIYTFDQGDKLKAEKIYYDRATVLAQLGIFREPTSILGRFLSAISHPVTIARACGRRILRR